MHLTFFQIFTICTYIAVIVSGLRAMAVDDRHWSFTKDPYYLEYHSYDYATPQEAATRKADTKTATNWLIFFAVMASICSCFAWS